MSTRTGTALRVIALAIAAAVAAGPAGAASIKCWTNKDGVRECGNFVPPEYSQQGYTEKSKTGLTIERTKAAETPEELKAEKEKADRLAKERAAAAEKKRARDERDRVLLATFTTEDDLKLTRDGQIASIDSRVKHTELIVDKLRSQLEGLEEEAAGQERSGKEVDPKLRTNIASVKQQISENLGYIDARKQEKQALVEKYDKDLARYRELKGIKPK